MRQKIKERGFTLIEVLTSIFIITILSGIIFANYRQSNRQFALLRSANKLAQDIRRAQQMAMSTKECPQKCEGGNPCPCAGQIPPGYGIYLNAGGTNYLLYADRDDSEDHSGGDTDIETIPLESGVSIQSTSPASLSINFKPPDPTTKINGGLADEGVITLALQSGLSKTIRVNKAGLIWVQ